MGSWGSGPWDNDAAADWALVLFEQTRLDKRIMKALELDIEEHAEIVRAAAHLVYLFTDPYVWPPDSADAALQLASEKLSDLTKVLEAPSKELGKERKELLSRLKKAKASQARSAEPKSPPAASGDAVDRAADKGPAPALRELWSIEAKPYPNVACVSADRVMIAADRHVLLDLDGNIIRSHDIQTDAYSRTMFLTATGNRFVVGDMRQTHVFSLPDGEIVKSFLWHPGTFAGGADLSADGSTLVVLTADGNVRVIDPGDGEERFALTHKTPKSAHGDDGSVAVDPRGEIAATSWPGSVCFWDLKSKKLIKRQKNKYRGVHFNEAGTVAYTNSPEGSITWDLRTGEKLSLSDQAPPSMHATEDLSMVFERGDDAVQPIISARPFDGESVRPKRAIGLVGPYAADITKRTLGTEVTSTVTVWDLRGPRLLFRGSFDGQCNRVCVSPDQSRLLAGVGGKLLCFALD